MRVLGLPMEGNFLVSGSAGSGKSIMALTRALNLAIVHPEDTVLLLVYVRSLSSFLGGMLSDVLPERTPVPNNLCIMGFHQYVYRCYQTFSGVPYGNIDSDGAAWDRFTDETASLLQEPTCQHLVVDEGQDYTASMIRFVRKCCSKSLTVFLDSAQTIFEGNGGLALYRQMLVLTEEPVYFSHDYRNCGEIADFANGLRASQYWQGMPEDPVLERDNNVDGRKPCVCYFAEREQEHSWLCQHDVLQNRGYQSTAFLFNENGEIAEFRDNLLKHGIPQRDIQIINRQIGCFNTHCGIFLATYHNAKGLEFDNVFLPDFYVSTYEKDIQEKLHLCYVAFTRAKSMLNICCTRMSPLFDALPDATYEMVNFCNKQRMSMDDYFDDNPF